jgi:hypothetical protein
MATAPLRPFGVEEVMSGFCLRGSFMNTRAFRSICFAH